VDTEPQITAISCQTFGDESRQILHGVAADPESNIIVVGDFWGSIDFGCSKLISAGDRDIFLAKFDRAGKCLWSLEPPIRASGRWMWIQIHMEPSSWPAPLTVPWILAGMR
jgi:hypothetical protein